MVNPTMADETIKTKTAKLLALTALSKDDVVAEKTLDIVLEQLGESSAFFRARAEEGFFDEASAEKAIKIAIGGETIAEKLMSGLETPIQQDGQTKPAYLAAADHLDLVAEILRGLALYPEWKDYYDDMARKLNEYSAGFRNDPDSSFRMI
jgi:hypothetical protein